MTPTRSMKARSTKARSMKARSRPVPVLAPVDPRLRRRRAQVRREAGRRRLRVLVGAVVLSVAVVGGWALFQGPLLDVDRVVVSGNVHLGAEEVRVAAGVERGTPMADVNPRAVGERVRHLGRVGAVDVIRDWPGTVVIRVTERPAVAVTSTNEAEGAGGRGGRWIVLDGAGRVLDWVESPPAGLVMVEHDGSGAPVVGETLAGLEGAMTVVRALPYELRPEVAAVVVADGGVDIRLARGGVVYLGPPHRVGEKLRALATVLERVDTAGMVVLDLRQPSRPALTRE